MLRQALAGGRHAGAACEKATALIGTTDLAAAVDRLGFLAVPHDDVARVPWTSAAFGNSTGDRQMLEYNKAGRGIRLAMIVLHDDAKREYAYGPAEGLPNTRVGYFPQGLYDDAKSRAGSSSA